MNPNGSNSNGHNELLHHILPIDDLTRAGKEIESLDKLQEYARSVARAVRNAAYDPSGMPDDREREDDHQRDRTLLPDAEIAVANALANVKEGERKAAELQKGIQEPKLPLKVLITGVAVIAVSLGPTLHDVFWATLDDQFLAWFLSMAAGALIGAFVAYCIASVHDATGQRSAVNFAGLLGGLGIGICGFLLRLSTGDFLIGLALTILEFAAVSLLELYAAPLREGYRRFVSSREAHTQAISVVHSLNTEATRRNQQLDEIRQRNEQHKAYVAVRAYCHEKFSEVEEAAVQIATKAFYEKQAERQRVKEEEQRHEDHERKRRLGLV